MQLEDRVENGDFLYDPKTGAFVRKPIPASVASKITNELINKTIILEKEVTKERITDEGLEDRLAKLREDMIRFAKAKTIEGTAEIVANTIEGTSITIEENNESTEPASEFSERNTEVVSEGSQFNTTGNEPPSDPCTSTDPITTDSDRLNPYGC